MSDMWGTREQPSDRDQGGSGLRPEHGFLLLAAISLSAACAAYALDSTLPFDLNRGAYSIMVALFVAGYCGWLSRSAERRLRREMHRLAAALRDEVEQLQQQVTSTRVVQMPQQRAASHRYASQAAVGGPDNDTVAFSRNGLDPQTIAAARTVAKRLLDGDESTG